MDTRADHIVMSKARVSRAGRATYATGERRIVLSPAVSTLVRVGYLIMIYLGSVLVYVGGGVLAALCSDIWHQGLVKFLWLVCALASLVILKVHRNMGTRLPHLADR
jgi:hypothetical protein